MALFVIADLHLSLNTNKPMDVFGDNWEEYMDKIEKNWQKNISHDDTVVIAGDISWAMNLEEAKLDLGFLDRLNGKKLLIKGNHDYWWGTVGKMERFFEDNGFTSLSLIHNCAQMYGNAAICGTRGWFSDLGDITGQNEKVFSRELQRLEVSLKDGLAKGASELIVFLHYPPIYEGYKCLKIIEILKKYNVKQCYYGHLHGYSQRKAVCDVIDGIQYYLIAADYLNFTPLEIL